MMHLPTPDAVSGGAEGYRCRDGGSAASEESFGVSGNRPQALDVLRGMPIFARLVGESLRPAAVLP